MRPLVSSVLGQTKAEVAAAVELVAAVAERRTQVRRASEPTAAAQNTVTRSWGYPGAAINWGTAVTNMIIVLHPFPDVAMHIEQTKSISRKAAYRRCIIAETVSTQGAITVGIIYPNIISPGIDRGRPCSGRILPF